MGFKGFMGVLRSVCRGLLGERLGMRAWVYTGWGTLVISRVIRALNWVIRTLS